MIIGTLGNNAKKSKEMHKTRRPWMSRSVYCLIDRVVQRFRYTEETLDIASKSLLKDVSI